MVSVLFHNNSVGDICCGCSVSLEHKRQSNHRRDCDRSWDRDCRAYKIYQVAASPEVLREYAIFCSCPLMGLIWGLEHHSLMLKIVGWCRHGRPSTRSSSWPCHDDSGEPITLNDPETAGAKRPRNSPAAWHPTPQRQTCSRAIDNAAPRIHPA